MYALFAVNMSKYEIVRFCVIAAFHPSEFKFRLLCVDIPESPYKKLHWPALPPHFPATGCRLRLPSDLLYCNTSRNKKKLNNIYLLIVVLLPKHLTMLRRETSTSNKVHQHDSISIEKVGENMAGQSNRPKGQHWQHTTSSYYVRNNGWLIVISIPISLGKQERRS
jgi:hypothetical protein